MSEGQASVATTRIAIPKETFPGERRVAATPASVAKLTRAGRHIHVETGAGHAAGFLDGAYKSAGASIVDDAWAVGDALWKVRPPTLEEVGRLREGALLVSLIHNAFQPPLEGMLKARRVTVLALEKIPRVTRAQKMDVLSSQASLVGYRAVLEAAAHYQGYFSAQVTAAASLPPAKVLIIGAGVAGLSAIATARALGAEVRAFDTRAATREQVESMGATFLEVTLKESGEGGGGYGKVMSPEFIAEEMALFSRQAKVVDIIITTALVPGAKAPILLPQEVVQHLKPGSVIVDLAAEQGGNCQLCRPGEVVDFKGIQVIGFTDLPSRMAATASQLFAMNLVHLAGELGPDIASINLENDVLRPALLLHQGEVLPALPAPKAQAPPPVVRHTNVPKAAPPRIMSQAGRAWGATLGGLALIAALFLLGRFAPADFLQHSTVFVLACFVGWQVVWAVTPALHTPLMSVTNAISGIIILGGMLQVGRMLNVATALGTLAVLFAAINVVGGFGVTHRMLKMFHREVAPPPPPPPPASNTKEG